MTFGSFFLKRKTESKFHKYFVLHLTSFFVGCAAQCENWDFSLFYWSIHSYTSIHSAHRSTSRCNWIYFHVGFQYNRGLQINLPIHSSNDKNKSVESTYLHQHQRTHCLDNSVHLLYIVFHSTFHRPMLAHSLRRNFRSTTRERRKKKERNKQMNNGKQRIAQTANWIGKLACRKCGVKKIREVKMLTSAWWERDIELILWLDEICRNLTNRIKLF